MKWLVAPRIRAELGGFTGINFSGQRMTVELWPSGSQKGDIDGARLKSIGVFAPIGTRVILRSSTAEEGWDAYSWRAFEVREGSTFTSRDGRRVGVQIPDLDFLDPPGAVRTDSVTQMTYRTVSSLEDRPEWTYGRVGHTSLKERVRSIVVDWVGD